MSRTKSRNEPQKTPRQVSEIQAEFQQACAQAGHLQYQIDVLTKDLTRLNGRLLDLNVEASTRNSLDKQKGTPVTLPTTAEAFSVA